MSYLLSLSSRLKSKAPAPAPKPAPQVQVVEVPVVEVPTAPPAEPFLSVSESVEPAPQSTSLTEEAVPEASTEAPSEE